MRILGHKRQFQWMGLMPILFWLFLAGPFLKEVQAQPDNSIRLRYYTGDRIDYGESILWSNYHIIWKGFGIGTSNVVINEENNGYTDRVMLKYDDFSYTFGQLLSLTLGFGNLSKSSEASSYKSSTGYNWKSETISGTPSYVALVGIKLFGFMELIVGTRASHYKVRDFERTTSSGTERLSKKLDKVTGMIMTGLGIVF